MKEPFQRPASFRIGLVLTVVEGLLSGCSYMVLYMVLTMLDGTKVTSEQILTAGGILLGVLLIRLFLYRIGYTQSQIGGAAVSKNIRLSLAEQLKKIPLCRFTKGQVGSYVNVITADVNSYEMILTHKAGSLTKNGTLAVLLLLFVMALYRPAGLVLLAAAFLLIPEMWLSFRIVKKYGTHKNKVAAETVSSMVEYIDGMQTFRAYGAGGRKNKATTEAMRQFSNVNYAFEAHAIPINFSFNLLNWLMVPVIMYMAAAPWQEGILSNINFLLLCMLPMVYAKLITAISIDLFSYKNLKISQNNIQSVMKEPTEEGDTISLPQDNHAIDFRHVTFSYNKGEPVLKDVSFTAEDGKLTALVGDSGAGKSTVLNLISRFYEADSGSISIGGQSIGNIRSEKVLEQLSMVDQEVFLFDDTVRENIRYARPSATDAEIEQACIAAGCHTFISNMEHGYDTPVGENGNCLSGGERQRLSIARAILKNSPILLLDEATSSLDIENELAVRQAIANLLLQKKTVVMIAHTLSVIRNADNILVLSGGKIVEEGTHEELLSHGGKYADMWQAEQSLSQSVS